MQNLPVSAYVTYKMESQRDPKILAQVHNYTFSALTNLFIGPICFKYIAHVYFLLWKCDEHEWVEGLLVTENPLPIVYNQYRQLN